MRMGEIEIYDYARQQLEARGDAAVLEAAQKACDCEEKGQREEAETWRHIGSSLEADARRAPKLRGLAVK